MLDRSPAGAVDWIPMAKGPSAFQKDIQIYYKHRVRVKPRKKVLHSYFTGRLDQMTLILLAHKSQKAFWCSSISFTYRI